MLYRNMEKNMKMLKKYFDDVITLVLYVRQVDTDLFQAVTVTMPTFVLHGVHMMNAWRIFHFLTLLKKLFVSK